MDAFSPIEIGSDFIGYRVEELIGRGGMGVVYRAYDLRLKRPVALKLVAPSLALDERFRERFARESELVMSLEHPNVVPIHDAGDVEGRVYLAMRFVDGRDLGSLLRAEGALEPARAIAICKQIAAALDAAHARGLVHRDVKPSNVLLDGSEHVYLADFGLTRRLDDAGSLAGEDFAGGTLAYLAPEQLDGGSVDGSTDVYSLGCVLYECLTGEAVFVRSSRLAVAWAHLEEEPPQAHERRAELPEAIDAVIRRALAKEPGRRYTTCGALVTAAGEALGLGTPRSSRRRTLVLAGAASLGVAAAAAVIAANLAHGARKSAVLPHPRLSGPNTLARIDPVTKRVAARIRVGLNPVVTAGAGRRVWVYSEGSGTVTEVDTTTSRVLGSTAVSLVPPAGCCGLYTGPVLAADASGAWFVRGGLVGKAQLVHVPVEGPERVYPLPLTPTGVAVGSGSVWIVGRTPHADEVVRFDPNDGRMTAKAFPVSARIDSIAFGYGWVWVVSSRTATLYRIDPAFRRRTRHVTVPPRSRATRPELIAGDVWFRQNGKGGLVTWLDPSTLGFVHHESDQLPSQEENVWRFPVLWWYDWPSGSVWWEPGANAPIHHFRVVRKLPGGWGQCLTSITAAGGSVWVTIAPLPVRYYDFACRT
jgi:serine/threonine-protein kinase